MNSASMKLHPLVAVAAASVVIVSMLGTAALLGWLPDSRSDGKDHEVAAISAAPLAPQAAAGARSAADAEPTPRAATAVPPPPAAAPRAATPAPTRHAQAAPVCAACGEVTGVRIIEVAGKPSGLGVVAGAVVGGLLGNQVGGGTGRSVATVAGAVGGGYAGNEIEKRARKDARHEVSVRMQGGTTRVFTFDEAPAWRAGDRVRVVNGALTAR